MEQITLRLPNDLLQELNDDADERGVSPSEHIRNVLRTRASRDALSERLEAREARIDQLEQQLRERSRVEEKIEDLPGKIRNVKSYQERRQRLLDQASFAERLKWKLTGGPAEPIDDDAQKRGTHDRLRTVWLRCPVIRGFC